MDGLLLPRESRGAWNEPPSPREKQHKQDKQPPNVARRISSLAAGLSESIRSRVADTVAERRRQQDRNERQQVLKDRMANAQTYSDWEAAARLLDELEDHNAWKASTQADDFYNPDLIASRLKDLEAARAASQAAHAAHAAAADPAACAHAVRRMMHLVRTALSRDIGGISNARLFYDDAQLSGSGGSNGHNADAPHTGTKYLVERYVRASVDLIQELLDRTRSVQTLPPGLSHRDMLDQLLLARRSYGRSALILSGGSVYGMAHIGVLKALFERRLLPRVISGTSAGSIVASIICTRTDDEVPDLLAKFAHGDLAVFTDKHHPDSWATHIGRALRFGAWHDSRHLARVMRDLLGDTTFQEAFYRTRRILNITVSSKPGLRLPSLLNYLTAPDVMIWSAVVASCSIPGIFDARPLLVRDANSGEHVPWDPAEQLWIDGSLDHDVPVERLGSMLNVNHFIVSQTNPHIVLFVDKTEPQRDTQPSPHQKSVADLLYMLGWLGKSEAIYALETLVDAGVFRGGASMLLQMLSQRYTADINIVPRMSLARWGTSLLANPSPDFMLEACRVGEQATWPCVSRIAQACAVELALDRAVHTLRERIAFSDSQVNLRRFFAGAHELGGGTVNINSSSAGASGGVRRNHSAVIGTRAKKSASPTLARSRSPTAHRQPPSSSSSLAQPQHMRHRRRGSGGSIQLLARRQHNRYALDTILSEEGSGRDLSHDSDGDDDTEGNNDNDNGRNSDNDNDVSGGSLAARRGMGDMNLQFGFPRAPLMRSKSVSYSYNSYNSSSYNSSYSSYYSHGSPSYHRAGKQNSLQQLPISMQTPRQTPRHTPRQTPRQTPSQTPRQTPRQTPLPTPKATARLAPPVFWRQPSDVAPFTAYGDDSSFEVDIGGADSDSGNGGNGGSADSRDALKKTNNVRRSRSVPVIVRQSRAALAQMQPRDGDNNNDNNNNNDDDDDMGWRETGLNEQLSDEEDETDDDDVFMTSRLK